MRVKERILMLRLMEKLQSHPVFAKALGIEVNSAEAHPNTESEPKGLMEA